MSRLSHGKRQTQLRKGVVIWSNFISTQFFSLKWKLYWVSLVPPMWLQTGDHGTEKTNPTGCFGGPPYINDALPPDTYSVWLSSLHLSLSSDQTWSHQSSWVLYGCVISYKYGWSDLCESIWFVGKTSPWRSTPKPNPQEVWADLHKKTFLQPIHEKLNTYKRSWVLIKSF